MTLKKKSTENIVGKEENVDISIFSFSHNVFSILFKTNFKSHLLSSANAFTLDQ